MPARNCAADARSAGEPGWSAAAAWDACSAFDGTAEAGDAVETLNGTGAAGNAALFGANAAAAVWKQ